MISLTAQLDAHIGERGVRVRASGPLELRGPLRRGDDTLYYLRNITAGVFAGDVYRTDVQCAPGASARVESSSATKVYSMPEGEAHAEVSLNLAPRSRLVWGPHATILHTDASLHQRTTVTLAPDALLLMAETLVLGRVAAGECFDFRGYEAELRVEAPAGDLLYREAYDLRPDDNLPETMSGLPALTTVYVLGAAPCDAESSLDVVTARRALAGWSRLPNGCGLIAKHLGVSLSQGQAFAMECLKALEHGGDG